MDPLSITLTVITLATALKDIIETAQAIQDSFSKLPQNYRNAQRLTQQLVDILRGMEEIHREHEEILNKKESLKNAIINLQKEMESAHKQCARLIPPVAERNSKTGRFKFAIYSFLNRKKVEQLLLELKDYVHGCAQHFQILSSIRTEAHVVEIRETLVQYTSHGSAGVHGHSSLGSTRMPHGGLANVSNAHLFTFTQSTPIPMTWIENSIPPHDLSNAYLRREVGMVNLSLRSILARWSQNLPPNLNLVSFDPAISCDLQKLPVSRININAHQDAVVHLFCFRTLLLDHPSTTWFQSVELALYALTSELQDLDMYEGALGLAALRVDMWRAMKRQYPCPTSSFGLVCALKELANISSRMGIWRQASSNCQEAIRILQSSVPSPANLQRKNEIVVMAKLTMIQAKCDPYPERSRQVQLAVDAVEMLEGILGITNLRSRTEIYSTSNWVVFAENKDISDEDWYTYARILLAMAKFHPSGYLESRKLAKLPLTILNHLLAKYPSSKKIQRSLINTLNYISGFGMDTSDSQAITENLKYVQQKVTILRQLAPFDPQRYVLRLARALWSQRKAFVDLGKLAEAENIYQDMLSLKNLAAAPLHSDLHIPSETEGDYYAQLAKYHYKVGRFSDAVDTAQNAISQYTALEFMDPSRSRVKHISTLIALCKYLNAGCQYDAAISEGLKLIEMIDHSGIYTSGSDLAIVNSYRDILCLMIDLLRVSSRPGAMALVEDINARILTLASSAKIMSNTKTGTS